MIDLSQETHKTLKAGDIRKKGDEQREKAHWMFYKPSRHVGSSDRSKAVNDPAGPWIPSCLLSHAILAADLIHLEFRRPL